MISKTGSVKMFLAVLISILVISGGVFLYLWYYKEKPQQDAVGESIFNVSIKTIEADTGNQIQTKIILFNPITNSIEKSILTTSDDYSAITIPVNTSFMVYNENLPGQD